MEKKPPLISHNRPGSLPGIGFGMDHRGKYFPGRRRTKLTPVTPYWKAFILACKLKGKGVQCFPGIARRQTIGQKGLKIREPERPQATPAPLFSSFSSTFLKALGVEYAVLAVDKLHQVHPGGKPGDIIPLPFGSFKCADLAPAEIIDHQLLDRIVVGKTDIIGCGIGIYHRPLARVPRVGPGSLGQSDGQQEKEEQ